MLFRSDGDEDVTDPTKSSHSKRETTVHSLERGEKDGTVSKIDDDNKAVNALAHLHRLNLSVHGSPNAPRKKQPQE